MRYAAFVVGILFSFMLAQPGEASLRVMPVLIDLKAPSAASSVRVFNDASKPMNVQVRIFEWSQKDGVDVYKPAAGVVASPPILKLGAGKENIVRIVRTTKQPILQEESYRLIIDELPAAKKRVDGTVSVMVRHSVPVFFSPQEVRDSAPSWTVRPVKNGYQVTLDNSGGQRIRIANLQIKNANGKVVMERKGLLGYALRNSTRTWTLPFSKGQGHAGGTLHIRAKTSTGEINGQAVVKSR